jgi:hypothetical protein
LVPDSSPGGLTKNVVPASASALAKFVETVRIAKNCRRIISQNFYGTLIVDTIGIGLAADGLLNPLLATFIHGLRVNLHLELNTVASTWGERQSCQPRAGTYACLGDFTRHRILNADVFGMILAVLSWAVIALMVHLFLRVIATGISWIYLD